MTGHVYHVQLFPPVFILLLPLVSNAAWDRRSIGASQSPDFDVRVQKEGQVVHDPEQAISPQKISTATDSAQKNPVSDYLLAKARLNGSIRVIVQLRIPVGPEQSLEKRIHAAQQGLLKELAPTAHRVVRSFTSIPAIALEASHDALAVLNLSVHVLRVDEDELSSPFIKPSLIRPSAGRVEATN